MQGTISDTGYSFRCRLQSQIQSTSSAIDTILDTGYNLSYRYNFRYRAQFQIQSTTSDTWNKFCIVDRVLTYLYLTFR